MYLQNFGLVLFCVILGGFYQDNIGVASRYPNHEACKKCNNGTWVQIPGTGYSSSDCVVCPDGTDRNRSAGYRACFCKANYTRKDRYGPCFPCDVTKYNCSNDVKTPLPGYFWSWELSGANSSQYMAFVGNTTQTGKPNSNSSSNYTGIIPNAFPCMRKKSCINNISINIKTQCEKGYQGWLCSKCSDGFFGALNLCVRCPKTTTLLVVMFIFASVCISFLILLSWQFEKGKTHKNKSRSLIDVMISRIKILLGFYQIVGKLLESLHNVTWADPLVPLGTLISLMELNIVRDVQGTRCLFKGLEFSPQRRFIIGMAMPIFIILFACLLYQVKRVYLKYKHLHSERFLVSTKLKKVKDRLLTYTVVLFFCMYPSISTVIFNMYPSACQEFQLGANAVKNNTKRLLRADYGVDCKTDTFYVYNIMAYFFTIVYIIAFPSTLFYFLWKHCSHWSNTSRDQSDDIPQTERKVHQAEEDMPLVVDYSDVPPVVPVWLNFLCENYKTRFWFWEILELIRKCTQTILLTIYGWDEHTVPLTICVSVLFLTLHARYMPMKCPHDQKLQVSNDVNRCDI